MPTIITRGAASAKALGFAGGVSGVWPIGTTYNFVSTYTSTTPFINGANLAAFQAAYGGQPFLTWSFSSPTNGVQQFVIQDTGVYRIVCAGGNGGGSNNQTTPGNEYSGGYGAIITADISLTVGTYLNILCGSRGGTYPGNQCGGGGGGSFVSTGSSWSSSTLIIAAGGGGGGGPQGGVWSATTAQLGTTGGGWGGGSGPSGGTQGAGSEDGASGGGWTGNGTGDAQCRGIAARSTPPVGVNGPYGSNVGGLGGGASGWGAAGGGGGYGGGGAQSFSYNAGNRYSAGGGSSYNTGTLISATSSNAYNGYVNITRMS